MTPTLHARKPSRPPPATTPTAAPLNTVDVSAYTCGTTATATNDYDDDDAVGNDGGTDYTHHANDYCDCIDDAYGDDDDVDGDS